MAIIGKKNDSATKSFLTTIRKGFFPNSVFAFSYDDEIEKNAKIIPLLEGRELHQGKVVAYVCHQGTCLPPVQTSEELVKLLSYE